MIIQSHLHVRFFTIFFINPFKTDKTAASGNLEHCLKWKAQAKCKVSLELTTRMNLGRRDTRQALDLRHSPQPPSQS